MATSHLPDRMSTTPLPEGTPQVCVARQPIMDLKNQVFGYELLYRAAFGDTSWAGGPGDQASARVLNDALLSLGLETLTSGKFAFLNVSHQVLLQDVVTVLPPEGIVVELLENIPATPEVEDACRSLQKRGYAIALDDFTPGCPAEALLPYAKYVKIDLLSTPPDQFAPLASRLLKSKLRLLAEKVETAEALKIASQAGCTLFQGYYFCKPTTYARGTMAPRKLAYLRLLAALNRPNVTVGSLEEIIKQDASFSYRVLRSANSAAFGLRQTVRSIHEALILIGQDRVRKWASIWAMAGMSDGVTPELVNITILRARCCELLGQSSTLTQEGSDHFLLGLCSLLDVILGKPMNLALEDLPLSTETRAALLGGDNPERHILDAVTAYERGAFEAAANAAAHGGVDADMLPDAYASALKWVWSLARSQAA
ncbi:MAG: HDOD domain-containing protein [Acidobacteria bacterium]|nr:HDOD domain-containing protein [Acidobacteriota bacterium]